MSHGSTNKQLFLATKHLVRSNARCERTRPGAVRGRTRLATKIVRRGDLAIPCLEFLFASAVRVVLVAATVPRKPWPNLATDWAEKYVAWSS